MSNELNILKVSKAVTGNNSLFKSYFLTTNFISDDDKIMKKHVLYKLRIDMTKKANFSNTFYTYY